MKITFRRLQIQQNGVNNSCFQCATLRQFFLINTLLMSSLFINTWTAINEIQRQREPLSGPRIDCFSCMVDSDWLSFDVPHAL